MTEATPVLRLDKWLWFARFYKTRANATRAIASGRFRLDGEVMRIEVLQGKLRMLVAYHPRYS